MHAMALRAGGLPHRQAQRSQSRAYVGWDEVVVCGNRRAHGSRRGICGGGFSRELFGESTKIKARG
jgi:hypothetical protein